MPEVPENESKKLHKITPMALRWSRMPVSRLQIFAVWVFVAILAAITGHAISLHVFEIASAACIAFFLWSFVQGPYLLYTKNWRPLRADYRVSENPIRPEFPKPRVDALLSLGFQPAGELVQEPAGRNVLAHFAMFIHPANKDSAQLGRIMSGLQIIHIVVFKARFDDGFAFETSNSHVAPIFEPDPRFHVFRFADVRSTHDLYRLHRKIKEQFFASQHSVLADERGELAEFMARAEVIHQKHAQGGDYKLSPAGDRYVYTWRGAIRHAWLFAWPIESFRRTRAHSAGMKLARELGLPINPKFGRLEESLRNRNTTADQGGL